MSFMAIFLLSIALIFMFVVIAEVTLAFLGVRTGQWLASGDEQELDAEISSRYRSLRNPKDGECL